MKRKSSAGLIILFVLLQACGGLRTELYREETRHGYQAACKLYKEGDYKAAGSGFEDVIAMDPDYGPAHAALGHLSLIREDYAGALRHYRAGILADPELEAELQPFIMVALAHKERAPLRHAGVSLDQLYPLIMAKRLNEVETFLAKDIPLRLLAADTMGITPGRLGEMQEMIAESADPSTGSVRYRLFAGYLLFHGQEDDALAADLIGNAVGQARGRDRSEALLVLGQLHERRGDPNTAVDAYLAAVDAGMPVMEVAHHLARVYRVDIESILPPKLPSVEAIEQSASTCVEVSTYLPSPPPPHLGAAAEAKDIAPSEHRSARKAF